MVNCVLRVVEAAQLPSSPPLSSPANMPFAHSSRFLCPLSSFLSVPRIFFPRSFPPSPPLPSTRHCFRNYDTNSSPPHSVCSVETQSACRWISNERAPTRILLASVFSIRSSLLLLRTINAPLKSYLSLSLFLSGRYL